MRTGIRTIAWSQSAIVAFCVLQAACGDSPNGIDGEVTAAGAPARISATEVSFIGGKGTKTVTTIDSATATYSVMTCESSPGGATCEHTTSQRSGSLQPIVRDKLFTDARSPDFRALRAAYRKPSTLQTPDYQSITLKITASERSREIFWETGSQTPDVLIQYFCSLRVARGDLITCYAPD